LALSRKHSAATYISPGSPTGYNDVA